MAERIRIGSRGSTLALAQTEEVVERLRRLVPECSVTVVPIVTTGDRDRATSLTVLGGSGVFAKELHEALLAGTIDLAVHSAKDLPTQLPPGLVLVAVLAREDARDVLVTSPPRKLGELPAGARVGTSSRRRQALLQRARPDLVVVDIRGNVDTRLRKLREGIVDALVLGAAGLRRLSQADLVAEYLDPDEFVPAPGQGALAVVARESDGRLELLSRLDEPLVHEAVAVERAFLAAFGSGCSVPLGAYATIAGNRLRFRIAVLLPDGRFIRQCLDWPREEAIERARELGLTLASREKRHVSQRTTDPLRGRRVLLVRPAGQETFLVERLRALGAEAVIHPLIRILPPEDWGPLDAALADLARFDWVVFTSANGVRATLERLRLLGGGSELLREKRLAAIGPATARALREYELEPDIVPDKFIAEAVAAQLIARGVAGARVLVARAAEAREILPRRLEEAGATVVVVPAYRTELLPLDEAIQAALEAGTLDWIFLTASSTARALAAALGDTKRLSDRIRIAAIGPVTAETARELGLRVDVVADTYTAEGLIEAVVRAERSRG
jgi:hydroxymethylbilane synthase